MSLLRRKSLLDNSCLDSWLTLNGPDLKLLIFFLILYQVLNETANTLPLNFPGALAQRKISWVDFLWVFYVSSRFSSRFYERFSDNIFRSYWQISSFLRTWKEHNLLLLWVLVNLEVIIWIRRDTNILEPCLMSQVADSPWASRVGWRGCRPIRALDWLPDYLIRWKLVVLFELDVVTNTEI